MIKGKWELQLTEREMSLLCRWLFTTQFNGAAVRDAAGIMAEIDRIGAGRNRDKEHEDGQSKG